MNETSDPFAELECVKNALRDGLALLDEGASSSADRDESERASAWATVAKRFATSESPEALRERVAPAEHARFDDELAELIRLNAVLVSAVTEEKESLLGKLRVVRESRRDLAFYGNVGTHGERCDLAG